MQLLLWVGAPLVLGLGQYVAYRSAVRRWQISRLIDRAEQTVKEDSREQAKALWHAVKVESVAERVSIGSSVEDPADMSATPTLTSNAFVVVDEQGHKFAIREGEEMTVLSLPGARRNLVEAVTTETGVDQRYSFELGPEQSFFILGTAHGHPAAGPFRDGAPVELEPMDEQYLVGDRQGDVPPRFTGNPGCGRSVSTVVLGMNIIAACAWPLPYVGRAYWAFAFFVGVAALFIHSAEVWGEGKLDGRSPNIIMHVKADLDAKRLPEPYAEPSDDDV
jgi:hypothetical protein